ncbi:YbjN domain-containing protein [Corynebacterium pygosceleis]|uniref:YbjN domain-containing protein n=1 Tax=Corynebacterium pygosceleis TaxID=2800406 RepID=A0A9Q4GJ36_9CORY|nr:YbjN domain-containing protein [Corynebacterium pygosceleis]MCK7636966.1 YbjN domain-containing protein [Corynebacterium pygosceleis]MCK7674440.1 YbjN domain-containing protein [Corynebacterium pygosceleis]MCL0120262.1 YbjN domain-containing protein [Corynebacterium pygosceleis]MCX7467719.1 YbjN domain-containing protein [Corynebacterium pygosceleis]
MSNDTDTGTTPPDGQTPGVGPVTFDDIRGIMRGFGVELTMADDPTIGGANLNGTQVTFAIIGGGVLLIRADVPTGDDASAGDPTLFLAANRFNALSFDVKATVVDRTEELILRTESETLLAAGMTPAQLTASVRSGVDVVLAAQQALAEISGSIRDTAHGQPSTDA